VSRAAAASVVTGALVLGAVVGGASPAAYRTPPKGTLDLLSSAHATAAQPAVSEAALDIARTRGADLEADTAALASSTCDACVTESTALHVVYAARARRARLDNVADAWAQGCTRCASTALSVQVVVLRGRPVAVPNNRAVALNAACDTCRASALAFQVVLVSDDATPLREAEMADLRRWFDEQAAALRASVVMPDPSSPTPSASPTAEPTTSPSPDPTTGPTGTLTPYAAPSSAPTTQPPPPLERSARAARRDAASALDGLTALLADALDAEPVSADVEVGR
jgi:hypothetical protein